MVVADTAEWGKKTAVRLSRFSPPRRRAFRVFASISTTLSLSPSLSPFLSIYIYISFFDHPSVVPCIVLVSRTLARPLSWWPSIFHPDETFVFPPFSRNRVTLHSPAIFVFKAVSGRFRGGKTKFLNNNRLNRPDDGAKPNLDVEYCYDSVQNVAGFVQQKNKKNVLKTKSIDKNAFDLKKVSVRFSLYVVRQCVTFGENMLIDFHDVHIKLMFVSSSSTSGRDRGIRRSRTVNFGQHFVVWYALNDAFRGMKGAISSDSTFSGASLNRRVKIKSLLL